jgi:hypothetical protein
MRTSERSTPQGTPPARGRRLLAAAGLPALLAALCAGCMQVDTHVKLHPDGSGTVTEKVRFSQRLLELAVKEKGSLQLETLLTREAALKRAKKMGKGVKLVSYKVRDAEKGSKESVAVYKVDYLGDFVYVSPFLARGGYPHNVKVNIYPYLSYRWTGQWPGALIIDFRPQGYKSARRPKAPKKKKSPPRKKGAPPPPPPAPGEMQVYRDLAPVFRDVFRGVRFRLTFETYCGITRAWGLAHRNRSGGTKKIDVINVSDKDLDAYGYNIFENEEIMTELLRWKLSAPKGARHFLTSHLRGMTDNQTLPVFHQGSSGAVGIRPSRQLFDMHLKGKILDWTGTPNHEIKARGKQPARFEWVGWTPPKKKPKKPGPKPAPKGGKRP